MRVIPILVAFALAVPLQRTSGGRTVYTDARLPQASIELRPNDPPATSKPWQLPKPGDPLYDRKKEAETKDTARTRTVHVFERGVFKGYATLTSGPPK